MPDYAIRHILRGIERTAYVTAVDQPTAVTALVNTYPQETVFLGQVTSGVIRPAYEPPLPVVTQVYPKTHYPPH